MNNYDLIVRIDESNDCLRFFVAKSSNVDVLLKNRTSQNDGKKLDEAQDAFSVTYPLSDIRAMNGDDAEKIVGKCVLGYFDKLTDGRINLSRRYDEDE